MNCLIIILVHLILCKIYFKSDKFVYILVANFFYPYVSTF